MGWYRSYYILLELPEYIGCDATNNILSGTNLRLCNIKNQCVISLEHGITKGMHTSKQPVIKSLAKHLYKPKTISFLQLPNGNSIFLLSIEEKYFTFSGLTDFLMHCYKKAFSNFKSIICYSEENILGLKKHTGKDLPIDYKTIAKSVFDKQYNGNYGVYHLLSYPYLNKTFKNELILLFMERYFSSPYSTEILLSTDCLARHTYCPYGDYLFGNPTKGKYAGSYNNYKRMYNYKLSDDNSKISIQTNLDKLKPFNSFPNCIKHIILSYYLLSIPFHKFSFKIFNSIYPLFNDNDKFVSFVFAFDDNEIY